MALPATEQAQSDEGDGASTFSRSLATLLGMLLALTVAATFVAYKHGFHAASASSFPDVNPEGHFSRAPPALAPIPAVAAAALPLAPLSPPASSTASSTPPPSLSPAPPAPAPAPRGVLFFTVQYGRQSNHRLALAEALALAVLLGRDLVVPDMGTTNNLYNWSAAEASFGGRVRFLLDAPEACLAAPVNVIGGPFGMMSGQPLQWGGAPRNYQAWINADLGARAHAAPLVDLLAQRADQLRGPEFTDELGVRHGPPETDFEHLQQWWPYPLYFSPGFARQNWGALPYSNLVAVLNATVPASAPCLVIDHAFWRVDWRQYPRTHGAVWRGLPLLDAYAASAEAFIAERFAGKPFLAVHLRQSDMCHHGCTHVAAEVAGMANASRFLPQCAGIEGAFVFSESPAPALESLLRAFFPSVHVGLPLGYGPASVDHHAVLEQEIGARAHCFIGNPNSTFSAIVRVRRQEVFGKGADTEMTYESSR